MSRVFAREGGREGGLQERMLILLCRLKSVKNIEKITKVRSTRRQSRSARTDTPRSP